MQRSRRALLQKRALETEITGRKHRLYKVSLSVVVVLWGVVFLLNLWISHSNGHSDGSEVPGHESAGLELNNGSDSGVKSSIMGIKESDMSTLSISSETKLSSCESSSVEDNGNDRPVLKERVEVATPGLGAKLEKDNPKSERLSHAAPVGLNEFKSRASSPKGKPVTGQAGSVIHRVETGGAEYNYASASKGAKVLAFNKEAKGASNILGKDKDKYLRNPCSAEEKFVVIELSEETLVDTIEIANFEHYSSNLKDFELLGSMVYPTENWVSLGNFTAESVKHAQRFTLQEPRWVRYLKVTLLSHYGSEFYCTLSAVEVYGVDAVERMLEDLISAQDDQFGYEKPTSEQTPFITPQVEPTVGDDLDQNVDADIDNESGAENSSGKPEVPETRPQQVGRMPGDTVLKILMQKVRSLDLNLSVLERYLEELNSRYGNIFKELDNEIDAKDTLTEKIRSDMKNYADSMEFIAKDVSNLIAWKSLVSLQMDNLVRDNTILRVEVEKVRLNQVHMENKGVAVFLISFIFGCVAVTKLFIDVMMSVCRIHKSREFCATSSWFVLLLSSSIVVIIILL